MAINIENPELQLDSLNNINWIDTSSIDPNVMMYWNEYANTMANVDMALNIFMLISFIWMGYGLYVLAKKMNIKNAWMGWVPLLQFYTMTQVAGVSFKKHVLYPILIILAIAILGGVIVVIWKVIFVPIIWIASLIAYIYYLVRFIQILSATSKRTGRGGWTTAGLFFIPFIMYPVVASKFKGLKEENKEEEKVVEL